MWETLLSSIDAGVWSSLWADIGRDGVPQVVLCMETEEESIDGWDMLSTGILYDNASGIVVGVGCDCDAGVDQACGASSVLGTSSSFMVIIGGVLGASCF